MEMRHTPRKTFIRGRFRRYDQFCDFHTRPDCYTTWVPLTSRDYYQKQVARESPILSLKKLRYYLCIRNRLA